MSVSRNRGFTLLELMLALTMLAVVVTIVFGTFRVGVRAWEKGESDVELRHKQRTVLEQMRRQLASMSTRLLLEDGQKPFSPRGEDSRLRFVSELPLLHENGYGLVYVEYRVDRGEGDGVILSLFERNLVFLEEDFFEDEPDADQFIQLLTGISSFSFEYMNRSAEGEKGEWQEEWNPEDEPFFPLAVKISLTVADDTPPIAVIAAVEGDMEP